MVAYDPETSSALTGRPPAVDAELTKVSGACNLYPECAGLVTEVWARGRFAGRSFSQSDLLNGSQPIGPRPPGGRGFPIRSSWPCNGTPRGSHPRGCMPPHVLSPSRPLHLSGWVSCHRPALPVRPSACSKFRDFSAGRSLPVHQRRACRYRQILRQAAYQSGLNHVVRRLVAGTLARRLRKMHLHPRAAPHFADTRNRQQYSDNFRAESSSPAANLRRERLNAFMQGRQGSRHSTPPSTLARHPRLLCSTGQGADAANRHGPATPHDAPFEQHDLSTSHMPDRINRRRSRSLTTPLLRLLLDRFTACTRHVLWPHANRHTAVHATHAALCGDLLGTVR